MDELLIIAFNEDETLVIGQLTQSRMMELAKLPFSKEVKQEMDTLANISKKFLPAIKRHITASNN